MRDRQQSRSDTERPQIQERSSEVSREKGQFDSVPDELCVNSREQSKTRLQLGLRFERKDVYAGDGVTPIISGSPPCNTDAADLAAARCGRACSGRPGNPVLVPFDTDCRRWHSRKQAVFVYCHGKRPAKSHTQAATARLRSLPPAVRSRSPGQARETPGSSPCGNRPASHRRCSPRTFAGCDRKAETSSTGSAP